MLDHFSIVVKDFDQSLLFYDETLKLLGYVRMEFLEDKEKKSKTAGYGEKSKPRPGFWISTLGDPKESVRMAQGVHIAFIAPNVKAIDAWHLKAMALGGKDNGTPGTRPNYHAGFYGAYIIDPNG